MATVFPMLYSIPSGSAGGKSCGLGRLRFAITNAPTAMQASRHRLTILTVSFRFDIKISSLMCVSGAAVNRASMYITILKGKMLYDYSATA